MFDNLIISPLDGLIPAAVSAVVVVAAWRPWNRSGAEINGQWGGPVALAAGFAVAFKSINGTLPHQFPPTEAKLWLFWIAVAAGVIGLIDALVKPPNWARLIAMIAASAFFVALTLLPRLKEPQTRTEPICWIVGASLVASLWWLAFERAADTDRGHLTRITSPLSMLALALCSGALLVMSHSIIYGKFGIALAGGAAPIAIVAATTKSYRDRGSAAMALILVLCPLLIAGHTYSDLTDWSVILIGVAPPFLLLSQMPPVRRIRPAAQVVISMGLMLLPLAIAIGIAVPEMLQTLSDQTGPYGE